MKPLFTGMEWDNNLILEMWEVIDKIGREQFGLSYYPNPNIELVSYDQMIYYCNNHGLPQHYDHWSFGKSYIQTKKQYQRGMHGLAYEVIINSNPLRAYLLDTNTATVQALVLAHAICGHGHFFTNNYLFKQWTIADYILEYMSFAHKYIKQCEEKYGYGEVEVLLDACHSLQNLGVDKYKRPGKIKEEKIQELYQAHLAEIEAKQHEWGESQKPKTMKQFRESLERSLPEENLLYYIEKHSPVLKPWQKEIVRIVRKIAQYFYPQYQTKLMNEGFASFVHYELMTELHNQGYLTDGSYLEFLHNHTQVCAAPEGAQVNPYSLGYAIFRDVFEKSGKDWGKIRDIVANYRDETFILQFLSEDVVKDFKLAALKDDTDTFVYKIEQVHDSESFEDLKVVFAKEWSHNNYFPSIEITNESIDKVITLSYRSENGVLLDYKQAKETLKFFNALWGGSNELLYFDENGKPIETQVNK